MLLAQLWADPLDRFSHHTESREDLDRWRDALATGDESLVSAEEQHSYRQWAARTIEDRPLYQRVDREAPRF